MYRTELRAWESDKTEAGRQERWKAYRDKTQRHSKAETENLTYEVTSEGLHLTIAIRANTKAGAV